MTRVTITWAKEHGGGSVAAETPEDLVALLHKTAFLMEPSVEEYMTGVAQRVKLWNGSEVRTDDAQTFLLDLERAGVITTEWEA